MLVRFLLVPLIMACVVMVSDYSEARERKAKKRWVDTGLAELLHDVKQVGRKVCMDGHTHYGMSIWNFSKAVSEKEAINSWEVFSKIEYGSNWSSFKKADGGKVVCSRDAYKRWKCDAQGSPCRMGMMKKKRSRRARK